MEDGAFGVWVSWRGKSYRLDLRGEGVQGGFVRVRGAVCMCVCSKAIH